VINSEFLNEYSEIVSQSKVFELISAYIQSSEMIDVIDLDKYVASKINKDDFTLWIFLRGYFSSMKFNDVNYKKLEGYFKFLGINDLEKFIHYKESQIIFEYLKQNAGNIRLYKDKMNEEDFDYVKFTCVYSKIYFYHKNGYYNSLELDSFWNKCGLMNNNLLEIERIDKNIAEEWIPVLVKIKQKYYWLKDIIE
jgi:hypothetical protein